MKTWLYQCPGCDARKTTPHDPDVEMDPPGAAYCIDCGTYFECNRENHIPDQRGDRLDRIAHSLDKLEGILEDILELARDNSAGGADRNG